MVKRRVYVLAAWSLLSASAHALTLEGRVVDIQAGTVLAGAEVKVGDAVARSDGAGFFRLVQLAPGATVVEVTPIVGGAFHARLQLPDRPRVFVELDRARHALPEEGDEY